MSTCEISPEELRQIAQAIEQAMAQLRAIEQGNDVRPMQYTARLCWETLYESREILRAKQAQSQL